MSRGRDRESGSNNKADEAEAEKTDEGKAEAAPALPSNGKSLCRVRHGGIYVAGILKERGDTFEADASDVPWMVGTGNIELVTR